MLDEFAGLFLDEFNFGPDGDHTAGSYRMSVLSA